MGNIIFVAFYHSLSLGIKFYENNVTHVKTGYKTMAAMNYFLNKSLVFVYKANEGGHIRIIAISHYLFFLVVFIKMSSG